MKVNQTTFSFLFSLCLRIASGHADTTQTHFIFLERAKFSSLNRYLYLVFSFLCQSNFARDSINFNFLPLRIDTHRVRQTLAESFVRSVSLNTEIIQQQYEQSCWLTEKKQTNISLISLLFFFSFSCRLAFFLESRHIQNKVKGKHVMQCQWFSGRNYYKRIWPIRTDVEDIQGHLPGAAGESILPNWKKCRK